MTDTVKSEVTKVIAGMVMVACLVIPAMFLIWGGIHAAQYFGILPDVHAAEQKRADASAENDLGSDYMMSLNGYKLDDAQAAIHFRKAANEGDASAYLPLGYLYGTGEGVPQDYAEAYFWYDLATAHPEVSLDPAADIETRNDVASHLTKSVLLATQERARKWLEAHPSN